MLISGPDKYSQCFFIVAFKLFRWFGVCIYNEVKLKCNGFYFHRQCASEVGLSLEQIHIIAEIVATQKYGMVCGC